MVLESSCCGSGTIVSCCGWCGIDNGTEDGVSDSWDGVLGGVVVSVITGDGAVVRIAIGVLFSLLSRSEWMGVDARSGGGGGGITSFGIMKVGGAG